MATLEDFYPPVSGGVSNYRDIDYTWQTPTPADYSDQTGFTVVTTVEEANTQLLANNYKLYFMNGTYDWTPYTYTIPLNADFHFRGQSEAGVIFDWAGGSNMFNLAQGTEASILITLNFNTASDGEPKSVIQCDDDPVVAGVVIGDYVRFSVAASDDTRTNDNLYKINDVTSTTMTIDGFMPTQSDLGDVIEVIKASSVLDGGLRVENLTMVEDIVFSNHWFNYDGGGIQPHCINFVFQDFTYLNKRSGGYGDLVEDGRYSNGLFDRCKFLVTGDADTIDCEGPQLGTGDILVRECYFEKCHTRYGPEGINFEDCYFENVPIWEGGGYYNNCTFEGSTPAHLALRDGTGYAKFHVSNCRYVNVRESEKRIAECKGFHTRSFSTAATNGNIINIGGLQTITGVFVVDTDGLIINIDLNQIYRRHFNGTTIVRYDGSTYVGGQVYVNSIGLI